MNAAARRLAALGTLDVAELRLELAELDRARAALAGLIAALEEHDEDRPREVAPSLAGVAEAAKRHGLHITSGRREVSLEEAAELIEEAEERHGRDDTDALADDLRAGARLTIVETSAPAPSAEEAIRIGEALIREHRAERADDAGDDVRQAEEDAPAPLPAATAPAPESSPTAPAPSDEPPHPHTTAFADRRDGAIVAELEARGDWTSSGELWRSLPDDLRGSSPSTLRRSFARLVEAGRLELRGKTASRRYRAVRDTPEPPPDPEPSEPANGPEEASTASEGPSPVRPGATSAHLAAAAPIKPAQPHPPRPTPARITAPGRPRALVGERPVEDAEAVPAHRPAPDVGKSGRLRRQEAAEARERERLRIAAETGTTLGGLIRDRKPVDGEGTLEGRLLSELGYRDGTLRELAARLGITTGSELEAVAQALKRLVDDGDVARSKTGTGDDDRRPAVYSAERALSPVG